MDRENKNRLGKLCNYYIVYGSSPDNEFYE